MLSEGYLDRLALVVKDVERSLFRQQESHILLIGAPDENFGRILLPGKQKPQRRSDGRR